MTSGFPGGTPDFFTGSQRSLNMNDQSLSDQETQIGRPDFIGKRSLAEFSLCSRNVKPRPSFQHTSPISTLSPLDFPTLLPEISHINAFPILTPPQSCILSNSTTQINSLQESDSKKLLQELEEQLLGDEDDGEAAASIVTHNEWSETIQNLIHESSPTSSSSSCPSTSFSVSCSKQSLIDAAVVISEGKTEALPQIFTRLQPLANIKGNSEQRLIAYMISALKSRVNPIADPPPIAELHSKEQAVATQMLFEASPCFKLGFMAANLAILEATSEFGLNKIHVLDFDIGRGGQYVHLLHALAAKKPAVFALKVTTLADSKEEEDLKSVGKFLKVLANQLGVGFAVCLTKSSNIKGWNRQNLGVEPDEALAVNFAFQLYKLPDESVTTENLRDGLLRRMKGLSPTVMTVVEQEMNSNTAPLAARVREVCEHYCALFESLDTTVPSDYSERVRIDEGLSLKMRNSVACEGRDRVERCEVFGKWRARVGMSGFKIRSLSHSITESLRVKLNSLARGNPGFTVSEQSGGICFCWMGRTLTVASAWC